MARIGITMPEDMTTRQWNFRQPPCRIRSQTKVPGKTRPGVRVSQPNDVELLDLLRKDPNRSRCHNAQHRQLQARLRKRRVGVLYNNQNACNQYHYVNSGQSQRKCRPVTNGFEAKGQPSMIPKMQTPTTLKRNRQEEDHESENRRLRLPWYRN